MLSHRKSKTLTAVLLLFTSVLSYLLLYKRVLILNQVDGSKHFQITQTFTNASKKTINNLSIWEPTRQNLNPADLKGNATHRRYGEPLHLYSLPEQVSGKSDITQKWHFDHRPTEKLNCFDLFTSNASVSPSLQTEITSLMVKNLRESLKRANDSCDEYIHHSGYITSSLTHLEASFPIAYSILVFKDVELFEILLRSIYRPQNVYCIHIDKKSSVEFRTNIETITNCFKNVFVTSKSVNVRWGTFSVLEPEIICLKELWENKVKWKYFINLTGQEMALRTNYELVKILKAFDGANNVESVRLNRERMKKAGKPPHHVNAVKGAIHVILSRAFVDFILHNQSAIDILEWSKNVQIPDEIYFSTLNYNRNLSAPGSYRGEAKTTSVNNPFFGRLKNWKSESTCHGKFVREVCVFGAKDLPLLATREEMFANKVHFGYYPEVVMCMQELLFNRTADEYHGHLDFNVSYYATRDFVKNRF